MAKKDEFAGPGWLPFEVKPFELGTFKPPPVTVRIGDTELRGEQRRRRAGKYMDNAFAGWRETWLTQDGKDLGYLDTCQFPPPNWESGEGDSKRVGVAGEIVGYPIVVAKPRTVGITRKTLVPIRVGERVFTLHANGELFEGEALVARIRKGPNVVRADGDDVIWGLASLLVLAQINPMFEANIQWENMLDPFLYLDAFTNWS
jgi:hypothetical protein